MITKKDFCNYIIDSYCKQQNIQREDLQDSHVEQSADVAVAMLYLNMIEDDTLRVFAQRRNGKFLRIFDKDSPLIEKTLSVKEMINLLPESLDNNWF